jgi:outer membrane protein, adhesin transport system
MCRCMHQARNLMQLQAWLLSAFFIIRKAFGAATGRSGDVLLVQPVWLLCEKYMHDNQIIQKYKKAFLKIKIMLNLLISTCVAFAFFRRLRQCAVLVLIGSLGLAAQAQEVRLSDLLDLAMTRHPSILQARSQAQAAGFELDTAKWGRYPALSSEVRSDTTYSQSLAKVEQSLWTGGRIQGRIDLGEANVRSALAGIREAEVNALSQVSGAFYEVLRLTARLKTAQDNVQEHQRLVDLISRRVKAQISPPADATLAQARWQQALTERLQIQRQLETTRNSLIQWAGPIVGVPVEPLKIDYQRANNEAWVVERAFQVSGQRQKLQAQIESAQAQIELAKAQGMPTLVAGYQHIVSGPMSAGMDRGRGYIGMQFQPGAGLSALSGTQAAVSRKDAAEQELQILERSLESQIKTLYSDIDVLQEQLAPALALQEGTAELVDSYLRQYQIGRKNWLDVLNAQREKTQAIYSAADVRYSLFQSQVKLLLLTGEIQGQKTTVIHE